MFELRLNFHDGAQRRERCLQLAHVIKTKLGGGAVIILQVTLHPVEFGD